MNLPRSSNGTSSPAVMTPEEKAEADSRSVYIGNVGVNLVSKRNLALLYSLNDTFPSNQFDDVFIYKMYRSG